MNTPHGQPEDFDAKDFALALEKALGEAFSGIALADKAAAKLIAFGVRLAETSRSINLTRILDPEGMAVRHFLDTYPLLQVLDEPAGPLLDMGTGGGNASPILRWALHNLSNVEGFHLLRKALQGQEEFERITAAPLPVQHEGSAPFAYSFVDESAPPEQAFMYALEIIYTDQTRAIIAQTGTPRSSGRFFFPLMILH